jgi:DNA-binding MarR family transcriptional regulator
MRIMPALPATDALALDVHRALLDLVRVYQFRDRDRVCCYDVSVSQSHALDRLRRLGPLTLNEFAESLFIEKSTASRLVDGLEAKGYASRARNEADRRTLVIRITRSGERLAARIEEDMIRAEAALLEGFSADEQGVVARLLAKLAEAASARVSFSQGVGTWSSAGSGSV